MSDILFEAFPRHHFSCFIFQPYILHVFTSSATFGMLGPKPVVTFVKKRNLNEILITNINN